MNQLVTVNAAQSLTIGEVERVAMAIAKGGLFGSKDPNAVLTLCLLAQAEGQHPAVVFRDYHLINGKPAKKAEAMLRDFISAGGKVEWHTLDDAKADATFTHPSGSARIEWTLERARQAGIANPMWKKYPRQMLRSRVISEGIRTVYPGATSGLYEENEVRDFAGDHSPVPAVEAQDGGLLTGHSQEESRRVEPEQSATDTLRQQLEQSVEQGARDYAFPAGPATGITQLKAMARNLWREIEGCGDSDELEPLLVTDENKAIIAQLAALENPAHREIWEGDGKDNPGLAGLINRKRDEFAQAQPNILRAG